MTGERVEITGSEMMGTFSALYAGTVTHQRLRPRRHRLAYRVFSLLVDLDELPSLDRRLKLFGHNRAALFSVYDRDHGDGGGTPLREFLERQLAAAGIDAAGGSIRMLCYPRILGYAFNPLTVYFCHDRDGALAAILYEVSNTFSERHLYVLPAAEADGVVRHSCRKEFFVSPFMPMDCRYAFRIRPPGEKLTVSIAEQDGEGPLLAAVFTGRRRPLTDGGLARALFTYPLMTFKVIAGIHWEALRLWLKGVPVFAHRPAASPVGVSVVPAQPRGEARA